MSEPIDIEGKATLCSDWPEWLKDAVEEAMDKAEANDWSTEQVIGYALLAARQAPEGVSEPVAMMLGAWDMDGDAISWLDGCEALKAGDYLYASPVTQTVSEDRRKFALGDRVTKLKGSSWTGHVVGFYSTSLTPVGYAVESENEPGSVQIYPEAALKGQ